jgi:hypothetical protein
MTDHAQEITDGIGVVKGEADNTGEPDPESIFDPEEVKGPDPDEWGDDEDRPKLYDQETEPVDDEGNPMDVKGPDPKVWGD